MSSCSRQPGVGVIGLVDPHLGHGGEAEHPEQQPDDDLAARRLAQPVDDPSARPVLPARGVRWRPDRQAWNTCLRIAATLVKIRMPSTTMTPVESWPPTPSRSPR